MKANGKIISKATKLLPLRAAQNTAKWFAIGIIVVVALLLHDNAVADSIFPLDLGSAAGFGVLAGSGITVAGPVNSTVINGNIGTFPTLSITGVGNIVLTGVNHNGDTVTQTAKTDLLTAYNAAAGRLPTTIYTPIFDLGGQILTSGVYNDPSSFAITGTLTLDAGGNPNAVWIFQAGSTLTLASGSQVILTNGAQAANIFWEVGSSATLETDSQFAGNILAHDSVTLDTGAIVNGRVLAMNGAVTLDDNLITIPAAIIPVVVPEPASALLVCFGLATMFVVRRRFFSESSLFKRSSKQQMKGKI